MPDSEGTCAYNDINSDRPMFGPLHSDLQETTLNNNLNSEYNKETHHLLSEIKDEFKSNNLILPVGKCDFPIDIYHAKSIPYWYQEMLQSKITETKSRLKCLSNVVNNICTSTRAHMKSIEHDHNITFCKMDCPRYPALDHPWTNSWKFDCRIRCKEIDKPNHIHTDNCESYILLEHSDTRVSTATSNISQMEYPEYVMNAIKIFQDFASDITRNKLSDSLNAHNTVHDKFMWSTIELTLRSNYLNQIMLVVRGKKIALFIPQLKKYFASGPGQNSNVISVLCIDQNRSKNKRNKPVKLTTISELNDKVGSILIQYDAKTDISFNSIEIIQLQTLIEDYAGMLEESALLDISCCNFGILTLMMSHKCKKVIGLNNAQRIDLYFSQIEKLRLLNNVHNVTFIDCKPEDILIRCSPLIKQCRTVAVLNLSTPYGKSKQVMQALRDIPSIWRVIVYGPFTNDFHGHISILTSRDDSVEECYLPIRSCILDKLPTAKNSFDIVILFERKSLVTPKLEPPLRSPISDVKSDFSDVQENFPQKLKNEHIESDLEIYNNDLLEIQENLQQSRNEHIESDLETRNYDLLDDQEILLHQENLFLQENLYQEEDLQQPSDDQHFTYPCLHDCPTPPRVKYSSPPPPPPSSTTPSPPLPLSLPIHCNLLHTLQFSTENEGVNDCKNLALSMTIKSEPVHSCETSSEALNDNNEVLDMEMSPNPQVTEKAIKQTIHSPTKPVFTNIILNGFEFTVQANKSYLNMKHRSEQLSAAIEKKLKGGEFDDKIKIIDEMKKKREHRKKVKSRIRVKNADEIMMSRVSENDDDLRILYVKRKKILEQLKEEKEVNYY